jgi:hypothetical protein
MSDRDKVIEKVETWLRNLSPIKRPKTIAKLEKAMKPLCFFQVAVMPVEDAFQFLLSEGTLFGHPSLHIQVISN